MAKPAVLIVVVALFLAGCGGSDGEERSKGCDDAKAWVTALASMGTPDANDLDALDSALRPVKEAEAALAKSAPGDVREALQTLDEVDVDTVVRSDQERRDQASATVNAWVADDCGLAMPR